MDFVFLRPPKLNPLVSRPEIPLVVIERCLHPGRAASGAKVDPAKLIVTWLAIRWLMAVFPKRRGFATRLIAERVGAHMTYVSGWTDKLIELGLLEKAGEVLPQRNLSRGGPQPIFSIPLDELERISNEIALNVVLKLGESDNGNGIADDLQLALDLSHSDAMHESPSDRIGDQTPDRIGDHRMDGWMDHGGREGSRAPAKKGRRGRPPAPPPTDPPPPTPDGESALPSHPLAIWQKACPAARPIDGEHLAALASEHDQSTAGYGWYWVGRAILAASLQEDVRSLAKVRTILTRWRSEASYGSDLPRKASRYERPIQPEPAAGRTARPAQPAEPRSERRMERPALPPGLKIAGRRAPPDGAD